LVYVVYPFAATTLSVAPLWAIMFFVMMLALGMGTMVKFFFKINLNKQI